MKSRYRISAPRIAGFLPTTICQHRQYLFSGRDRTTVDVLAKDNFHGHDTVAGLMEYGAA